MPRDLSPYLNMPEKDVVGELVQALGWDGARSARIAARAAATIRSMRDGKRKPGSIENFFQAYSLSTQEGIALMCLAEALLRIPDAATANALIRDKIARTEWLKGKGGDDWVLRMAGFGLSAGKSTLEGPLSKLGSPVIRKAIGEGMKILGGQFVLGQTIDEAQKNAAAIQKEKPYLFSYDMLGEGARTREDAEYYFKAYEAAIDSIGRNRARHDTAHPGISVKLSALHPRYAFAQEAHCVPALTAKLTALARMAANYNICLTVDAEECDRLETSFKIIRPVIEDVTMTGWEGFGLAVQAYGKRAVPLLDNLIELARANSRRIQIRLVKGAYWDTEIKRAQVKGLADYPVFTRRGHTDISYLACAHKLLRARDAVYPMFGTHNAYTVQAVLDMANGNMEGFEFQRLFGMGDSLHDVVLKEEKVKVRIYAPVGVHRDLLPYLVRRLLENGANSSFVNKVFDNRISPETLAADPVEKAMERGFAPHPSIPLPDRIFWNRDNSAGYDLDDAPTLQQLLHDMEDAFIARERIAASIINGQSDKGGISNEIRNPADTTELIGMAYSANPALVDRAFQSACRAQPVWNEIESYRRAAVLNRIADLYEANAATLLTLCVSEAGKTLPDAVAELREAVDFCRYYAAQGVADFSENGQNLRSYTGESNKIMLQGRAPAPGPWPSSAPRHLAPHRA